MAILIQLPHHPSFPPPMSINEGQIKREIARLTGIQSNRSRRRASLNTMIYDPASINQHKLGNFKSTTEGRSNTYVNPNYKPANKYIRPNSNVASHPPPQSRPTQPASTQIKDVVLNGVAFECSGRSLVRKDREFPFGVSLF